MRQLTQKLGKGELRVQEVPLPQLEKGCVLVRNHYSIISGGTEGSTVSAARKGIIGKVKDRPHQAKQVLDTFATQGLTQTYRAVTKKLDSYSALGYSSSGEVIELGRGVTEFEVGDLVACAGAGYANHAEVVAVPVNLCVKLSKTADLKHSAYNTLGAIAMQGVRQADLRIGEVCVVVGLGLLGQLVCMILRASGVHVIGVDVAPSAVGQSLANGIVDHAYCRSESGIEELIHAASFGYGADAVVIAAAADDTDPINFAGTVSRKKGRVVVLGAVPTGFERDPHWYRKELELRMACSYGPGRYDPQYEEQGIDYPLAYVRWTEKRNMEAFQGLIEKGLLPMDCLTTHEFPFEDAPKAFDIIVNKKEPYTGIALRYNFDKPVIRTALSINDFDRSVESQIGVSFIGAGSYAQSHLLPNIPAVPEVERVGVMSTSGTTSKRVAEKYNFAFCTSEVADIVCERTNVVFIATRHDSHASYVMKALEAGKNVFVEKPLCLTTMELDEIATLQRDTGKALMVGFNRRFSPHVQMIKSNFGAGPMSMIYRINAGSIPADSWIQDVDIGGGRIVGEACHFIDLLTHINGSLPTAVSATALPDPEGFNDTVNIIIQFQNGSTGLVAYYANGPKELPKEYLEVFSSGSTAILQDFKSLRILGRGRAVRSNLWSQNKGQKEMVASFIGKLLEDGSTPISFDDIYAVTKVCLLALQSIRDGGRMISLHD